MNFPSNNKAFTGLVNRLNIDIRDVQRLGEDNIADDIDLSRVLFRFVHWLLTDEQGIRKYAGPVVLYSMDNIAGLYARLAAGEKIAPGEWEIEQQAAKIATQTTPEHMEAACEAAVAAEAAAEPEAVCAWMLAFSAAEAHACAVDDGQEETQAAVAETFLRARNRIAAKLLELVKAEAKALT
jgi:hypothetical protein